MKITKRQLRKIIMEANRKWDWEDNVSYFIAAGPPEKAVKYLEKLIAHAESGGEVNWGDALNNNEPDKMTIDYAKKRLELLKMGDGVGRADQFEGTKITKRQLRRIISQAKTKLQENLKENYEDPHGGAYTNLDADMENAVWTAVEMYQEVNGVDEEEAKQLVVDHVTEILGINR